MDKSWKHANWKKPVTKDHMWFHLYEISRVDKSSETENILVNDKD
jgi:hypothetical protein